MRLPPGRGARAGIAAGILVALAVVPAVVLLRGDGPNEPAASSPSAGVSTAQTSPSATTTAPPAPTGSSTPGTAPPPPATTSATSTPGTPGSLRGRDVTVLPTTRHVVALTFDAGGDAAGLQSILRTLAAENVRATFFLTGRWVAANPGGVSAVIAGGHRIGNHSVSHPHVTALSTAQITAEVLGAQSTIRSAGADPRPLFRFPFGDRDARTIAAVNALGYVAVSWTVDTLGWEGTAGGMSAQRVADRALAGLRPGEIVLMHVGANPDDGTTFDADALPAVIHRMRAAGYGFVTLDALLGS